MGDKKQRRMDLHHKQVMDAKIRQAEMKLKNKAAWEAVKAAGLLHYEYLKMARVFYTLAFLLALAAILTVGLYIVVGDWNG